MPRLLPFLLLVACVAPLAAEPALVAVTLKSGRTFHGVVDRATNDQTLVLRSGSASIALQRPIAWERVELAESAGKPLTPNELKQLAANDQGGPPPPPANETRPGVIIRHYPPQPEPLEPAAETRPNPPMSLRMDAAVMNWDQDVEQDGLLVLLEPLDAYGNLTPVSGTVEVVWYGGRRRDFNMGPYDNGWKAERLGLWQVPLRSEDLTYRGYVVKLPFQNMHPDFDIRIVNYSLVNVRLNVPGRGAFEASLDGVRVRPWSPFRDMLQQRERTRWLPTEVTGLGKNSP